jgi:hypothetical protein
MIESDVDGLTLVECVEQGIWLQFFLLNGYALL